MRSLFQGVHHDSRPERVIAERRLKGNEPPLPLKKPRLAANSVP
jgi:hypothetical protein